MWLSIDPADQPGEAADGWRVPGPAGLSYHGPAGSERPRAGERPARALFRLRPTELRLPGPEHWSSPVRIAGLHEALSAAGQVPVIRIGGLELQLADPLDASLWRFLVRRLDPRPAPAGPGPPDTPASVVVPLTASRPDRPAGPRPSGADPFPPPPRRRSPR